MRKKGLSSVIATVLLLLLTVAAVAALSQIVIPFVKERLYGSTECLKYKDSFSFVNEIEGKNYNCYEKSGTNHYQGTSIKIKSGLNESDQNLKGLQLSFQTETGSEQFNIYKNNTLNLPSMWVLGENEFYFPKNGEIITYAFNLAKQYDKIEVRSIIGKNKFCEVSDSIEIIECDPTVDLTIRSTP